MQIMVIMLRKILLIGVFPPVLAFTLLLPYPPKAGRALKHPPTKLATPRATSSRLGLKAIPWIPSLPSPPPRLLAATDDSKNPRRAIRNEVPIASRTCFKWSTWKGQWKGKGLPVDDLTSPRISMSRCSQSNCQLKIADMTTTRNLSGIYATLG